MYSAESPAAILSLCFAHWYELVCSRNKFVMVTPNMDFPKLSIQERIEVQGEGEIIANRRGNSVYCRLSLISWEKLGPGEEFPLGLC